LHPFEGYEYIDREAIEEGYKGTFDYGVVEMSLPVTEAALLGNLAYGMGQNVNKDAQGKVLYNGNWIGIFKQEGGEWKIHRLVAVSKPKPASTTSDEGN
jgi:ketosteroid isomerase-like protein